MDIKETAKEKRENEPRQVVIQIEGVDFAYNGISVLQQVNLTVSQGDSLCIVGPNGGGKSTLIKLILGLLNPSHGKITLLGDTPEKTRHQVGYVPQYALYDPYFPVSVLDVVLMGRLGPGLCGRYCRADRQAAMAALDEIGLAGIAKVSFAELSGGQRQRVLIARALASAAEMLILDEPTANVDAQAEIGLLELLKELNRRMTVLLVTHDLGFVSKFFQSVACVNHHVHIHPTSEISGEIIHELYGGEMSMIRHDHRCTEGGHFCG